MTWDFNFKEEEYIPIIGDRCEVVEDFQFGDGEILPQGTKGKIVNHDDDIEHDGIERLEFYFDKEVKMKNGTFYMGVFYGLPGLKLRKIA